MPADVLIEGPISLSDLSVTWDASTRILPADVQSRIDACWATQLADARVAGRDLFNGPILTLRRFSQSGTSVTLTLALSDYKTFLVTCVRDRDWFLAHAPDALAPALGSSALLTCGPSAYLGVRSPRVAAYPGKAHLFGGVVDTTDRPPTAQSLLAHLERELVEELSLSPADFSAPPTLLGLFRDQALFQPELVWHWPLVRPISHLHPHEHDGLHIQRIGGPLDEVRFTPIALAALNLATA